ncbi:hypothetical protein [Nocardioides pacificus]
MVVVVVVGRCAGARFDAPFTLVGPEPLRAAAAELAGRLEDSV